MVDAGEWSKILAGLETAKTATLVLGEPLSVQDVMLVPVVSISGACGTSTVLGGMGGVGVKVDPVAVVAVQESRVDVFSLRPGPQQRSER